MKQNIQVKTLPDLSRWLQIKWFMIWYTPSYHSLECLIDGVLASVGVSINNIQKWKL
jgi:hypothetical protein